MTSGGNASLSLRESLIRAEVFGIASLTWQRNCVLQILMLPWHCLSLSGHQIRSVIFYVDSVINFYGKLSVLYPK